MARYRVIGPKGHVVATIKIESAEVAHAWFVDAKADNSELGWRMEVQHNGDDWHFFDDTELRARPITTAAQGRVGT